MWRLKQLIPKEQVGLEGKSVEVGSLKLQIRTTIAQGGFSSVYLARDAKSGKQFAVKHIICNDTESLDLVKKEVATMKALRGHPNIITLHAQSMYDMGRTKECFLVLEYCDKMLANVLDSKEGSYLDERQVLLIFRDVCNAVYAMHSQSPPIAHRDLKAENVLLGSDGWWKLCDFGSTSTNHKRFDRADEMGIEEDIIRKHTTPAYRAPEMWDLYRRDIISEKVDIWALGCLLYRIAYQKSAFDGESKLQILNGNYRLPDSPKYSSNITGLIKDMLNSSPEARPDAMQVWLRVNESLPSDSRKVAPDKAPSAWSTQPTSVTIERGQPLTMPTRAPPLPPRDAEQRSPPPGHKEWDHGTLKEANYHTASSAEKNAPLGSFWATQYAQEAQSGTDGAAARDKSFISGSPPGRPTRTANVHVLGDQETAKNSASLKSGASRKVNDTVHHTKPFLGKEDAYEARLDDDLGNRLVHSKDNTGLSYKGLQESTKVTMDEAFSEFVAEFQKTKSEDTYAVTEASLSEVESLKVELKKVQAEKIDIASKYEKLTAICRSQRLEIQELKSALAAAQGQNSKSQAKETAQTTFSQAAQRRSSQSSSEQRPDKQVGSIWDLQEGLSFSSSTRTFGSEQQGWKAFDDAPGFQASPKLLSNRKDVHHDATGGNEVFGSARFDGAKFDSGPKFDSPKCDSPKSGALNGNGKKQPHSRAASFAVGDAWGFQDSFSALGGGFEVAKSTGQSKQSESASGVYGFSSSKDEGRSARVVNQTQPAGWAGF